MIVKSASFFSHRSLPLIAIALLSGLLMGITPAPIHAWFLAWIALAPLWILIHSPSAPLPLRSKLLMATVWAMGYHGTAISWIRDLHPLTWLGMSWLASVAITLFAWVCIVVWGGLLVSTWVWGMDRVQRLWQSRGSSGGSIPPWLRVLLGTSLWCVLETLWSDSPLWWTSLSFTQSPYNLVILHLGQLSGPTLVTGAIVAVNGFLAEAWLFRQSSPLLNREMPLAASTAGKFSRRYGAIALFLFLTFHSIGWVRYHQPLVTHPDFSLQIGIIQGNVPTRIKLFAEGLRRAKIAYLDGYGALADQGVDAVLTPEGALPYYWLGMDYSRDPLYQAVLQEGIPLWLGTPGLQNGRITQSLITVAGDGRIFSRYDKIKLVPLGEYLPFEAILGRVIQRLSPVELSMIPGQPDQQFETPVGRAIAAICFDSAFASLFRRQAKAGGEFILTAANNDPYGRAMMAQHHAQDVMRAIETDRWAIRATNTGLSGVADPHGRTVWLSGFRTYETHVAQIERRQTQTLYVQWGDWVTPLLGLGAIASWIIVRRPANGSQ